MLTFPSQAGMYVASIDMKPVSVTVVFL